MTCFTPFVCFLTANVLSLMLKNDETALFNYPDSLLMLLLRLPTTEANREQVATTRPFVTVHPEEETVGHQERRPIGEERTRAESNEEKKPGDGNLGRKCEKSAFM